MNATVNDRNKKKSKVAQMAKNMPSTIIVNANYSFSIYASSPIKWVGISEYILLHMGLGRGESSNEWDLVPMLDCSFQQLEGSLLTL